MHDGASSHIPKIGHQAVDHVKGDNSPAGGHECSSSSASSGKSSSVSSGKSSSVNPSTSSPVSSGKSSSVSSGKGSTVSSGKRLSVSSGKGSSASSRKGLSVSSRKGLSVSSENSGDTPGIDYGVSSYTPAVDDEIGSDILEKNNASSGNQAGDENAVVAD